MCKKQFLEYFSEESCKSCSSNLKADKCHEFDECSSHSFEYFKAGFEANKKEYEEKLRWIPVEEKLPPLNEYVLFKYSEGEYCVGCLNNYGYYCTTYIPAENDFLSIHLLSEVTHWRSFL